MADSVIGVGLLDRAGIVGYLVLGNVKVVCGPLNSTGTFVGHGRYGACRCCVEDQRIVKLT